MHTELSLMLIRFTPQYKGRLDLSSKEKKKPYPAMQNIWGKIRNHSCLQASLTCVKTFMWPLTRAEIEPVSITRRMYIRVTVQEQFLK